MNLILIKSGYFPAVIVKNDRLKYYDFSTVDVYKDEGVITKYNVSGFGWLDFETTFKMICFHEIDNARPVFPKKRVGDLILEVGVIDIYSTIFLTGVKLEICIDNFFAISLWDDLKYG